MGSCKQLPTLWMTKHISTQPEPLTTSPLRTLRSLEGLSHHPNPLSWTRLRTSQTPQISQLTSPSRAIFTYPQSPQPSHHTSTRMERDLENANPTILSVSELPSRRRKGLARTGPDARCDKIVFPRHHWPYGATSSSSDEDEDYAEEPLDEQDIYGTRPMLIPSLLMTTHHLLRNYLSRRL